MKSMHRIVTAVTLSVSARPASTAKYQSQSMQGMQGMQGQNQKGPSGKMNNMTETCQKHMSQMRRSNDREKRDIEAAKASNDPAKMWTALDEAEKRLTNMNDHMKICMNMMNIMQNMHGMGSMMNNQDQGKQTAPPKQ